MILTQLGGSTRSRHDGSSYFLFTITKRQEILHGFAERLQLLNMTLFPSSHLIILYTLLGGRENSVFSGDDRVDTEHCVPSEAHVMR